MNNLCRDLLSEIFRLIDPDELYLLIDVNKSWNNLIEENPKKKWKYSELFDLSRYFKSWVIKYKIILRVHAIYFFENHF